MKVLGFLSFFCLLTGLVACRKSTETPVVENYVSIKNLQVEPHGTSLSVSPRITWQIAFPVFSTLEVGIGDSAQAEPNVYPWTELGVGTSATISGLSLTECQRYYPMVRAKNIDYKVLDTHVVTEPFLVDLSAPTAPSSLVVVENGTGTRSSTVSWTAATDNCALQGYDYAIGTTAGGTQTVNWSPVAGVSHQVTAGASFTYGTNYFTSVRAVDEVEQTSATVTTPAWRLRSPSAYLTGTQTLSGLDFNQGSSYVRWSASTFNSFYFSHSPLIDSEKIFIRQAGDYILHFTLPLQVISGCTTRCSIRAYAVVNGAPVPFAVANSSYVISASAFSESSDHMVVYLQNLSVNDDVRIFVEKGTPQLGVVNTELAQAYMEYVLPGRDLFMATATRSVASTNLNGASSSDVIWAQQKTSSSVTWAGGTPSQLPLAAGNYMVYINFPFEAIGACSTRNQVRLEVRLGGAIINGGLANQGGIDCSSGHTTGSAHWYGLLQGVGAGQILTVSVVREAGTSQIEVQSGKQGSIVIERFSALENYISLRGTRTVGSTNWNLATSPLQWDTAVATDPSHFTHSTVVNNDQITINRAGDYLLVFNDSLTSGVTRANVRIRVQRNGVDVNGGLCTSNIITNLNGHNESSCALSFLLTGVSSGEIITLTATQEAAAGTITALQPALLSLLRVR